MSDNLQSDLHRDSAQGEACGTSGPGCRPCGSGKFLLVLLVGLAVVYILANRPAGPSAPSAVAWVTDHDQGLALASEQNQPVLLAFKASWCGPCRTMDNQVFSKQAAADALSGWVPVSVDVDTQQRVAARYDVSGIPAFVALSPTGQEIGRAAGGMSLAEFAQFLASAEARTAAMTAQAD
jgi:thiol:disulfide interchange protein